MIFSCHVLFILKILTRGARYTSFTSSTPQLSIETNRKIGAVETILQTERTARKAGRRRSSWRVEGAGSSPFPRLIAISRSWGCINSTLRSPGSNVDPDSACLCAPSFVSASAFERSRPHPPVDSCSLRETNTTSPNKSHVYRKSDTIEIGFSGGARNYLEANQIIIYRIFIYRMFLRGFMCIM